MCLFASVKKSNEIIQKGSLFYEVKENDEIKFSLANNSKRKQIFFIFAVIFHFLIVIIFGLGSFFFIYDSLFDNLLIEQ